MKVKNGIGRREILALALTTAAFSAQAQPSVTKVVVPFPAGGITDAVARALVDRMSRSLGQTMIVENRPGAGSRIGTELVAKASDDNNTLLFTNSSYSILPILDKSAKYDPMTALAPVIVAGTYGLQIVVSMKVPASSLDELISYARKNPGKLSYGSSGQGSGSHFAGEYFKHLTKTNMVHIPYKSTSAAAMDVASGFLDVAFDSTSKPHADAGRLKVVAVTGEQRDPRMPNVPTTAEAGLGSFVLSSWVGLLAPPGASSATISRWNQAAATALKDPEMQKILSDFGVNPGGGPISKLAQVVADEINLYRKILRDTQMKVD